MKQKKLQVIRQLPSSSRSFPKKPLQILLQRKASITYHIILITVSTTNQNTRNNYQDMYWSTHWSLDPELISNSKNAANLKSWRLYEVVSGKRALGGLTPFFGRLQKWILRFSMYLYPKNFGWNCFIFFKKLNFCHGTSIPFPLCWKLQTHLSHTGCALISDTPLRF